MDENKITEAIKVLQEQDGAGVKFAEARQLLVSKGFSETEIIQATYRFPYDGKPNTPPAKDSMQEFYQQHPELADETAKSLLAEIGKREKDKLIANSIGSAVGDTQTTSYYEVQTSDQIGFPYYTFFFLTIVVGVLGIKYEWLGFLVSLVSFIASAYFIYLWYMHWRSTKKRR